MISTVVWGTGNVGRAAIRADDVDTVIGARPQAVVYAAWLVDAAPGLYDALDVPLQPAVGKLGRR